MKKSWLKSWRKWKSQVTDRFPSKGDVYIVPTVSGLWFGLSVPLVLVNAATFQSNLAYALCFLLLTLWFIAMLATNRQMRRLDFVSHIEDLADEGGVLAGGVLASASRASHIQITIVLKDAENNRYEVSTFVGLVEGSTAFVWEGVKLQPGIYDIHRVNVTTRAPFGLFKAWRVYGISKKLHVVPRPEGDKPADMKETGDRPGHWETRGVVGDDLTGHKDWVPGDSFKAIDWRVLARLDQLLVKEFAGGRHQHFKFSEQDLLELEGIARLRMIRAWLEKAKVEHQSFTLYLIGGYSNTYDPESASDMSAIYKALAERAEELKRSG